MKSYKTYTYVPETKENLKTYVAAKNKQQAATKTKTKLRKQFGYSGRKLFITHIYLIK